MGKSKKRIFNKNKNSNGSTIKRQDTVQLIIHNIKNNLMDIETKNLISLFGITAEELAEEGATYEELKALKNIL